MLFRQIYLVSIWSIFYLFPVLASSELVFSDNFEQSLTVEMLETFKGEFECLPSNTSGKVRVLRFDILVENNSPEVVALQDKLTFWYEFIDKSDTVRLNGTVSFDCLRDKICDDSPTYYVCDWKKLSPNCRYTRTREADCQWIDISSLPVDKYNFLFSLQPINEGPVPETNTTLLNIDLNLKKIQIYERQTVLIFVVCTTLFLLVDFWVICLPFVRHMRQKTNSTDGKLQ